MVIYYSLFFFIAFSEHHTGVVYQCFQGTTVVSVGGGKGTCSIHGWYGIKTSPSSSPQIFFQLKLKSQLVNVLPTLKSAHVNRT